MSTAPAILVLDLGTTHLKATVFTLEGTVVSQASAAYPANERPCASTRTSTSTGTAATRQG